MAESRFLRDVDKLIKDLLDIRNDVPNFQHTDIGGRIDNIVADIRRWDQEYTSVVAIEPNQTNIVPGLRRVEWEQDHTPKSTRENKDQLDITTGIDTDLVKILVEEYSPPNKRKKENEGQSEAASDIPGDTSNDACEQSLAASVRDETRDNRQNPINDPKDLRHLSLSNINARAVSKGIALAKNLTRLYLTKVGSGLRTVPDELGELSDLHFLHITQNALTAIPKGVVNLRNLEELHINHNYITSSGIGSIAPLKASLTFLDIASNKLTDIGPLCHLEKLTYLDVSYNTISTIPPEINRLKKLMFLSFKGNCLTEVCPEILELWNAQTMCYAENMISKFPWEEPESKKGSGRLLPKLRILCLPSNRLDDEIQKALIHSKLYERVDVRFNSKGHCHGSRTKGSLDCESEVFKYDVYIWSSMEGKDQATVEKIKTEINLLFPEYQVKSKIFDILPGQVIAREHEHYLQNSRITIVLFTESFDDHQLGLYDKMGESSGEKETNGSDHLHGVRQSYTMIPVYNEGGLEKLKRHQLGRCYRTLSLDDEDFTQRLEKAIRGQ